MIIKGEKVELSLLERFHMLVICFCSAGGIACISMSALGYPAYKLLLASMATPIYVGLLLLPFTLYYLKRKPAEVKPHVAEQSKLSWFEYLKIYVIGGCKLVANKGFVICILEIIDSIFNIHQMDFSFLTYWPTTLLIKLGFDDTAASVVANSFVMKTLVNRDMSMIYLANSNVFDGLTVLQQCFALPLIINIVSLSALTIISLNIIAMFGKEGYQFIRVLPFAFLTALIVPLIPVGLYGLYVS
ncbi:hypothetical protein [Shewanella youngdeokensis]|uniref:Uncharacterized protein n=1 Tax=Shewanella youngdeokensis TaxID=2999068 RepID=A0ABZ0K0U4_9GAMM|nr:hypothetical protein RGE70_00730 [Shewanella sp. DAU334]